MGTKSILLAVSDPQVLVDITQALGHAWEATSVSSEADALAQLEQRTFDALLVDFNLGSPDASQLLNQALEKRPETTRFLLAYEADLALVAAYVSGPHEILPKPVEPASLKSRIERGVATGDPNCDQGGSRSSAVTSAPPSVPAVYAEVLKALDSPDVTMSSVGEIIASDAALTSEVLKLTNSAYLGLPRDIADPVAAVELLGLETVKGLVMARRFLAEHSQLKPGYLSLEKLWQHSTNVAQLARDLVLFETKDRTLAAQALVAGLLHDLGKVVLASNFDDLYGRVHSLARNQPVALWEIEKEMFGATHGEIGACLVGMWNMSGAVVQAAAFHHEPPLGEDQELTPLAAVHIANVLEHQSRPSEEFRVAPAISTAFLNELGLLQRLPVWRARFANRPSAPKRPARSRRGARALFAKRQAPGASPQVQPAGTSQPQAVAPVFPSTPASSTANQLPAPTTATRTTTSGQPESEGGMPVAPAYRQRRWVYAGAAAVALALLALWLQTPPERPVHALTPEFTTARAPAVVPPAPAPEPAPAVVPEDTPAIETSEEATPLMGLWEEELGIEPADEPGPAPALPEPEPTVAVAPQVTATVVTPPAPAPAEKPQPEFRLNGIIYTVARPAAIVNRQTVYVGDRLSGATVVRIDRTQVTLQINGQRKSYTLR